jgi:hypothetical protein
VGDFLYSKLQKACSYRVKGTIQRREFLHMISQDIEKEIQQKKKIMFGLDIRQFFCVIFAATCAIVFALILSPSLSIYPSMVVGVLCWAVGWYHKDGLTAEKYLIKVLREKFYKNGNRNYRTKNKYIALMNKEYRRRERIDRADKKIAKALKKEQKSNQKRVKATKLRAIQ